MLISQASTYSLVDILGGPQALLLGGSLVIVLIVCGVGLVRRSVRLIGTSFAFLSLVCLGNLGRVYFSSGSQYYRISMENNAMDPSLYAMKLSYLHASVGASLLAICLGGVIALVSFFAVKPRT